MVFLEGRRKGVTIQPAYYGIKHQCALVTRVSLKHSVKSPDYRFILSRAMPRVTDLNQASRLKTKIMRGMAFKLMESGSLASPLGGLAI